MLLKAKSVIPKKHKGLLGQAYRLLTKSTKRVIHKKMALLVSAVALHIKAML